MNMGLIDSVTSRHTLPLSNPTSHKLRSTQAIVAAVSHFLVQNRVRILRTGQNLGVLPGRLEDW